MNPGTITIAQYVRLPEQDRPPALYNGTRVQRIYPDRSWPDEERYVVRLGDVGYGSKRPDTLLTLPTPASDTPPVIEHIGRKWRPVLSHYRNNRPALILAPNDPRERADAKDHLVCSINLGDIFLETGNIHIRTWGPAHETLLPQLVAGGVVSETGRWAVAGLGHFASVCVITLSPAAALPWPW